jgi:predicted nucleic acid-binding protein
MGKNWCKLYNQIMKQKVYIETSVISYLTARPSRDIIVAANQQATQEWWLKRKPDFDIYISQLVIQEASAGNAQAVFERQAILNDLTMLDLSKESVALAERLVKEKAIPEQAAEDALHIALAAVNGMDYLITWNFKHIANAALRANVELVCRLSDYEPPIICSPLELMEA